MDVIEVTVSDEDGVDPRERVARRILRIAVGPGVDDNDLAGG